MIRVVFTIAAVVAVASAGGPGERGALRLEAMQGVCGVSKALKEMYQYVVKKTDVSEAMLEDVEKMVKLAKLKVVKEKETGPECDKMAFFLKYMVGGLDRMVGMIASVRKKGLSLAAAAGLAAGRLDEFVSVFQQPNNRNGVEFFSCAAGARGEAATKAELHDCFQGGKTAVDAAEFLSVEDVEEKKGSQAEGRANLEEAIRRHLKLSNNDPRYTGGESQGCQLVRGSSGGGYLGNASLTTNLLWGDGIFGVKKDGVGETAYIGDTRNETYSYDMMWEENPTTNVPTLRAAMDAYRAFEEQVSEYGDIYRSLTEEWTEKTIGRRADAMKILNGLGSLPIENVSALNSRTKQDWLSAGQVKDADKDLLMTEIGLCGGLGRRSFFRRMFRKAWRKIFGGNWGKDD
ncbi:procyclin-associated gene 2 (PAG2) protein [Trypanosoma equiperdum]|nr:procyclin-associated gene 2 (PAG2) protein [Trypanosoma equiperdum]